MKPLIWITLILIISISGLSMFYNQDLYYKHLESVHEDPSAAKQISDQLISYFQNSDYTPPNIDEFTELENSHLLDVKIRMCATFYLLPILIILLLYFLKLPDHLNQITGGAAYSLVLTALCSVLPFNLVFLIFHLILFPHGNWMFPQYSALIQTFPRPFWLFMAQSLAYRIIALSLFTLILVFVLNGIRKTDTSIRKV